MQHTQNSTGSDCGAIIFRSSRYSSFAYNSGRALLPARHFLLLVVRNVLIVRFIDAVAIRRLLRILGLSAAGSLLGRFI